MYEFSFNPNLTPRQVIEEGAFGGCYFGYPIDSPIEYDYQTLFRYHFDGLNPELYLGNTYKPKINKWRIRSGMDYNYWKEMGWINEQDPYGWFEWYCKYVMGRRSDDDERQIGRWQDFCGRNGRWRNNIYSKVYAEERNSGRVNFQVSPRIQQSLVHWGYEVNAEDYSLWKRWKGIKG
jgi:hypothetical protein